LVQGVAHEVKAGYVLSSAHVNNEIREDAWLISTGQLQGAHYHFCASEGSNTIGASPTVIALLEEKGIPYTIHLPR